ncbi:MAG: PQQ-dependent sugar dehydrogenase [Proteobacteria bacterium]|nr:PQQ-dependent sugar dehydrogenase [Pseudomonadota bacterium]
MPMATAGLSSVFVGGLERPHGLAIHVGYLYIGTPKTIWRVPFSAGQTRARGAAEPFTERGALGSGGGHWTRNLVFSGDGARVFVAVGSHANVGEEPEVRASVQQFAANGRGQRTLAGGLRNPVGIARYPGTDDLYVVVNERDGLGDGLVPDFLTRVVDGGFYGWPYAYIGNHPDPALGSKRPDLVAKSRVPDVLFQAHSAPLGLVFYDADQFPAGYRGDAFVALHGSWNAQRPTGYKIVRVPFENGRPSGGYETFLSGFWIAGADRARVWGRPAGLAIALDGSLLVADDGSQTVWRVSYRN